MPPPQKIIQEKYIKISEIANNKERGGGKAGEGPEMPGETTLEQRAPVSEGNREPVPMGKNQPCVCGGQKGTIKQSRCGVTPTTATTTTTATDYYCGTTAITSPGDTQALTLQW